MSRPPYPLTKNSVRTIEICPVCDEETPAFAAREGAQKYFSAHYGKGGFPNGCDGSQRRVEE